MLSLMESVMNGSFEDFDNRTAITGAQEFPNEPLWWCLSPKEIDEAPLGNHLSPQSLYLLPICYCGNSSSKGRGEERTIVTSSQISLKRHPPTRPYLNSVWNGKSSTIWFFPDKNGVFLTIIAFNSVYFESSSSVCSKWNRVLSYCIIEVTHCSIFTKLGFLHADVEGSSSGLVIKSQTPTKVKSE